MQRLNENVGKLELILGCMYSGKSTALINKRRQYELLGKTTFAINHSYDDRYGTFAICSHDRATTDAFTSDELMPLLSCDRYKRADILLIEEAQFFADLYEFVEHAVEKDDKHVIISGLDGDYRRRPYDQLMRLIPLADVVERRNALCIECKDGTLASFSKRIVENDDSVLVGANDAYIPVCRYHYKKTNDGDF